MKILAYMTHLGHPALWDNMFSLVMAMSMEHEVRICDINNDDEMRGVLYQILANPNHFDMSVGFNDMGMQWNLGEDSSKVNLYE